MSVILVAEMEAKTRRMLRRFLEGFCTKSCYS